MAKTRIDFESDNVRAMEAYKKATSNYIRDLIVNIV